MTPNRPEKRQNGRRFKENGEPSFTINSQDRHGVLIKDRIRRFTPKECFRLQGFKDGEIDFGNISDSALYKLVGNGWSINVVTKIVRNLLK